MRLGRSLVLAGALLAGLAIWPGPAGAAERPDAREAKVKITKIKIEVGRRQNVLFGSVYSHNAGCVGGRRARVFAVTGSSRRLLDTHRSVRYGRIGYFRLAIGRFKWNQTYRIVTAPRRVNRSLRCEGDRQTYRVDCDRDAVLDIGRPTTNCYPLPTGPTALEGNVTTTYVSEGLTQVFTAAVRLTRIAKPGTGNVQGGLHEATLAYRTAPGTLNWTESGTHKAPAAPMKGPASWRSARNSPMRGRPARPGLGAAGVRARHAQLRSWYPLPRREHRLPLRAADLDLHGRAA